MATTFHDASKQFLLYCQSERRLSAHTVRAYRSDLARFSEFLSGRNRDASVELIGKEQLRAYQQALTNLKPRSVCRLASAAGMVRETFVQGISFNSTSVSTAAPGTERSAPAGTVFFQSVAKTRLR